MPVKSYAWIKPVIFSAIAGSILTIVVGFSQGGWTLSSKAEQMAADRASSAVAAALASICAERFFAQADAPAKLVELKKLASDYAQSEFVEKGGWAKATDTAASSDQLQAACAKRILAAKPA